MVSGCWKARMAPVGMAGFIVAGLINGGGCVEQNRPVGTPVEQAWEAPPAPEPPVSAVVSGSGVPTGTTTLPAAGSEDNPAADEPVAMVNGRPIPRRQFIRMLIENKGLQLLEQMVLLAAVEQRAAELGLTVTSDDVAAAHEDALRRIAQPIGGEGAPLDRGMAERLLYEFLIAKNISRDQWDLRMRQQAHLRKIAEAEVAAMSINEPMLREEYALVYGERVQVRHIQVSSPAAAERARAALQARGDFAAVAREMSENQITAASGGLLPPFTRNDDDVPPLIRETAFKMKPGEISPAVQQDNWYHILKLERRFPASDVAFENVDRDTLKAHLIERLVRQRQETLEAELFRAARVEIRDEVLDKQFREKYQR